jgi:DNA-binding response OmpR family regulator
LSHRILIIEDEALIALDLEDALTSAGFEVVGISKSLSEALAATAKGDFKVAILDAFLSGASSAPIAAALLASSAPFVVVSGYEADGLDWAKGARFVAKPYNYGELCAVLNELCD